MPILIEKIDDIVIVLIDIERATVLDADDFNDIIKLEINNGSKKFIIDLNTCDFIDSTFLAALVATYKKIAKNCGQLKLVGFKPAVQSMFELTQLSRVFDIYNDEQKALTSFE